MQHIMQYTMQCTTQYTMHSIFNVVTGAWRKACMAISGRRCSLQKHVEAVAAFLEGIKAVKQVPTKLHEVLLCFPLLPTDALGALCWLWPGAGSLLVFRLLYCGARLTVFSCSVVLLCSNLCFPVWLRRRQCEPLCTVLAPAFTDYSQQPFCSLFFAVDPIRWRSDPLCSFLLAAWLLRRRPSSLPGTVSFLLPLCWR